MARHFKRIIYGICQLNFLVLCFSQKFLGDSCNDVNGREGICVTLPDCTAAREQLKKGIRPVNCGFEGLDPIVCCPLGLETETVLPPSGPSRKPGEAAKYWCDVYAHPCPKIHSIAGGINALPSEFPHMAAIGYGEENNRNWYCGGSLISENFVVTAAHCLTSGGAGPARWVLLGSEVLTNTTLERRKGQIHPVLRRIIHPAYKPPSKYHDVALLEIGPAITPDALPMVSRRLHPACLPTRDWPYSSYKAIATGWGRVGHGEDGSPQLLKVELDIFELSKCNETFDVEIRTTNWLQNGIDTTMLCAGVLEGGKDTCQGDSGGPLQYIKWKNCMYEIWEITSFGKVCAFANSPAVYMRVSEYVPWIESIVWPITV